MPYLSFISDDDLENHITETLKTYKDVLKSINLTQFNKNLIDPIKLTFDSIVYKKTFEQLINNELARQRDKTNTNAIGYFHQNIFKYIKNCEVPKSGFDVIYNNPEGNNIYVEMKNKHNTMNSSASQKTFMKLQAQALKDPSCYCFLVEVIAKHSQNIPWILSLDGIKVSNERIRRVSIDKFYEIVTDETKAFFNLCNILPNVISKIVDSSDYFKIEEDTVLKELGNTNENILKSLYLLAFKTYEGFDKYL